MAVLRNDVFGKGGSAVETGEEVSVGDETECDVDGLPHRKERNSARRTGGFESRVQSRVLLNFLPVRHDSLSPAHPVVPPHNLLERISPPRCHSAPDNSRKIEPIGHPDE